MKNSRPNPNSGDAVTGRIPRVDAKRVLKAFDRLGFSEDVRTQTVIVLRERDFPFRRLTLPNHSDFSVELLKLYIIDLNLDVRLFNAHLR